MVRIDMCAKDKVLGMRVLHVIGAMDRGGAESLLMNIYRNIDRKKIQFDFLVHEDRKCDFDDEIESLGGGLFRIRRFNGMNGIAYRASCGAFFEENHDFAAVHVHIGSCAAMVIREAKKHGLYCIAHSHSKNGPLSPMELAFRFFSYPTRYLADYFLACSRTAGIDRFGLKVAESDRFAVLNNGIEIAKYCFDPAVRQKYRKSFGLLPFERAVCHVGRFVEQKNHRFLIEAFAKACGEDSNLKLFLVGRGPLESAVRAQVGELGIDDRVVFLGVRDDVPSLLMAMDLFVFPSVTEGLGIAAIEAQAVGLPCLLSCELPDMALCAPYAEKVSTLKYPSVWADKIIEISPRSNAVRMDGQDFVRNAGFDVVETAAFLRGLYSGQAKPA